MFPRGLPWGSQVGCLGGGIRMLSQRMQGASGPSRARGRGQREAPWGPLSWACGG